MEYTYLNAGRCYLFWDYEDGRENPKLVIDIIDILIEPDRYKGSYYLEDFGWDAVWDQDVRLIKEHFELICMLEDVGSVMTPRIKTFFRKAIAELFETDHRWDR